MKKKTMAMLIALVLVLTCAVGGTLAWLTAQSGPVTNTFTPSNIDITLVESDSPDDEDTNGNINSYKMVPGNDIAKDPKVTVLAGSEKCYLFVEVLENGAADATADSADTIVDAYLGYDIADDWELVAGTTNIYWRIVDTADMGKEFSVLKDDKVTVLGAVTKTDMDNLKNGTVAEPKLTFNAYAVQYVNIFDAEKTPEANAAYAWSKAKTQAE